MSDPDPTDGGRADAPSGTASGRSDATEAATDTAADDGGEQYARFKRYVNYAVLAGLLLLAFVAVIQLYFAASSTIATWVSPDYRAPFRMAFNLVVLLLAGLGVSVQLRRLGGEGGDTDDRAGADRGS